MHVLSTFMGGGGGGEQAMVSIQLFSPGLLAITRVFSVSGFFTQHCCRSSVPYIRNPVSRWDRHASQVIARRSESVQWEGRGSPY